MNCYKAAPISRERIRCYVRQIRKEIGLEKELYFPVLEFLEHIIPAVVPDFQLEIVPCSEMPGKHAETFPDNHIVRIREDVYCGAAEGKGRDRLTIAHEIGHLFLHGNNAISLCRLASREKLRRFEDPEWQANAFGGELLASSYLIKGMSAEDVHRKCVVSMDCAQVQLATLDR